MFVQYLNLYLLLIYTVMAFQKSGSYDQSEALDRRVASNRDAQRVDPNVIALANKNKQEVLSKRAGLASMNRLKQEYADQGIDMNGDMDEDGNIAWNYKSNIFDKVKAAGKDLSRAPQNEFAARAQLGNAQVNQYAQPDAETGKLTNIESGDAQALLQAQEQSAQNARRTLPDGKPDPLANAPQSLPSQGISQAPQQATAQSILFGGQFPQIHQDPQGPKGDLAQLPNQQPPSLPPGMKLKTGEKYSAHRDIGTQDSSSGGNSPLMTSLQYERGGYEDPGKVQASQRLRNAMYGIQGDVQRGIGITEGPTAEERRGSTDEKQTDARYGAYNQQVMQPKMQGQMSGGNMQLSSGMNSHNSQSVSQSKDETQAGAAAAQAAAERTSMNFLSGNKVTIDGTGKVVFGTEAEPADLEGTRFLEDVTNGKVRGVKVDGRGKIVFSSGANVREYSDELRGRIANRGATGVSDNTLPAATARAAGMRDLGAVQGQQRQVGNPDPSSAPNYNQIFDQKRQDSLLNAAKRIKKGLKK